MLTYLNSLFSEIISMSIIEIGKKKIKEIMENQGNLKRVGGKLKYLRVSFISKKTREPQLTNGTQRIQVASIYQDKRPTRLY